MLDGPQAQLELCVCTAIIQIEDRTELACTASQGGLPFWPPSQNTGSSSCLSIRPIWATRAAFAVHTSADVGRSHSAGTQSARVFCRAVL